MDKQKIKMIYGVNERQFANYVTHAREQGGKDAPGMLHTMLERRLDNTVFVLGLVPSRAFARQVVSHGHITVNGTKVTVPSYQLSVNDVITIRPGSRSNAIFRAMAERMAEASVPSWLSFDAEKGTARVLSLPSADAGAMGLNFPSVIEFYSR